MTPDLSQLHDIHLPSPISWWPPALGWWFLAGLCLVLIGFSVWWLRQYRHERWRRVAQAELIRLRRSYQASTLNAHDTVCRLSVLLRRIVLTAFPRSAVASLHDEAWLAFLDSALNGEQPFQQGIGRCLITTPYMATVHVEVEALLKLVERWLKVVTSNARDVEHQQFM